MAHATGYRTKGRQANMTRDSTEGYEPFNICEMKDAYAGSSPRTKPENRNKRKMRLNSNRMERINA
jgi:hypothetical protein